MIKRGILKQLGMPLRIGDQIKVNHEGCPAGVDTKSRLYIKRVTGGVVGYCHHCSDKGYHRESSYDGRKLREWLRGEGSEEHEVSPTLKVILTPYTTIHNPHILKWLHQYYITAEDKLNPYFTDYFGENAGNLIIGLYDRHNFRRGQQVRPFIGTGPKYKTTWTNNFMGDTAWYRSSSPGTTATLVVTEDCVSAYRVNRDANVDSMALLRTSMSDSTMTYIISAGYQNVLLWLDGDDPGWEGSLKIWKRFAYRYPGLPVSRIRSLDDPKTYEPSNILATVTDELKRF